MESKAIVSSDKITAIANAIRSKTGKTEMLSLDDMPSEIESIETGGGSNANHIKFIATPTSTSVFTFDNPLGVTGLSIDVKYIGTYEGSSRKIVKYVADGELGIGVMECVSSSDVVRYSSKIDNASAGNGEFKITTESISLYQYSAANNWDTSAEYEIELIDDNGSGAETGGSTDTRFKELVEGTLTDIIDDTITTTATYAFYQKTSLVNVSLTNLTSLGSYSFNGCTGLVSVDLPSLNVPVSTFVFDGCTALQQVNIQNATGVNNYAFRDTTSLEKLELEGSVSIGSYSFNRSGITALIIRNDTTKLTKLNSTNAFTGCPIANGTGYIYFYREFVESYKSATGWSNYAEQIRAIEDYPEITGG